MKNFKMLFIFILIVGSIIALSSYSMLSMWLGLEMNSMAIIPLMSKKKNLMPIESAIKYFITQAMASMVLIMSSLMMITESSFTQLMETSSPLIMFTSALLTKMGMTPFHFWFPEVMEGLTWLNCSIMLTWQKIAPMVIMMYWMPHNVLYQTIIISGTMTSSLLSFNQTSLRKLMTFSSINHMSWMMMSMMTNQIIWWLYFIIYSLTTLIMMWIFNAVKINQINQMYIMMNQNNQFKLLLMINFMNLGGLPPLPSFLPKWMIIETMMKLNMNFTALIMVMFTLIMIFIYLKMMMTSLTLGESTYNWKNKQNTKMFSMSLMNYLNLTAITSITILFNLM